MQDEKQKREELLETLRAEVARLLCADDVSEAEKVSRLKRAQEIIETGVDKEGSGYAAISPAR